MCCCHYFEEEKERKAANQPVIKEAKEFPYSAQKYTSKLFLQIIAA